MRRLLLTASLLLAVLPVAASARADEVPSILVGASAQNVTPFTTTNAGNVHSDANPDASNPDGESGGLWDNFMTEGALFPGQVTDTGLWGESYTDSNGNGRWDYGELFIDDPVNTRLDPDSAGKYDGVWMAGYGSDRPALGAIDPIWVRAVYVFDPVTGESYVHATVDTIAWFSDVNDRIKSLALKMYAEQSPDPELTLDHVVVSHTHNHEGPDMHVGLYGPGDPIVGAIPTDGTYPRYEKYVEYKMAMAIADAMAGATSADIRVAAMDPHTQFQTVRGNTETLAGMMSRNNCRTPWVFDDQLRTVQFVNGSDTIATIVNWGAHVESLDSGNKQLSSDFPHTVRQTVEDALGGVAMYVPGAQGAGEIIGDSCTARWRRDTFDGADVYRESNGGIAHGPARTYAIGRVVGSAAVAALADASTEPDPRITEFVDADLYIPINNTALFAFGAAQVIDKPSSSGTAGNPNFPFVQTPTTQPVADAAGLHHGTPAGTDAKTHIFAWKLGSATFGTAPGELFPEIWWGLSSHGKQAGPAERVHGDYTTPNPAYEACAAAPWSYGTPKGGNTGRPLEPGIHEALDRWGGNESKVEFLLGYTPDLLGYIVPGVDFAWFSTTQVVGDYGIGGSVTGEVEDPCKDIDIDTGHAGIRYKNHYQENNSASSMLAPGYTCEMWKLLGLDPATSAEGRAACDEWEEWKNLGVTHVSVDPSKTSTERPDPVSHY